MLRHSGRPREPGRAPRDARGGAPAQTIISHARRPPLWTHVHRGTLSAKLGLAARGRESSDPFTLNDSSSTCTGPSSPRTKQTDDKQFRGRGHGHCAGLSRGQAFSVWPPPASAPSLPGPGRAAVPALGWRREREPSVHSRDRWARGSPGRVKLKCKFGWGSKSRKLQGEMGGQPHPSPPIGPSVRPPLRSRRTQVWSLMGWVGGRGSRGQVAGLKPPEPQPL